jgi:hypothetical protein
MLLVTRHAVSELSAMVFTGFFLQAVSTTNISNPAFMSFFIMQFYTLDALIHQRFNTTIAYSNYRICQKEQKRIM